MSDEPFSAMPPIPLMTAEKARDIGRAHKAWAGQLADWGLAREALRAERDAQWWLTYALALGQNPPALGQ